MPSLKDHQSQKVTKMLFEGDSGSGKTGALASLVDAGYELVIVDFDNGLDILFHELQRKDKYPNADLAKVWYETCTDKMKSLGGKPIVDGVPKAWQRAMELMTHWKTPEYDLGKTTEWGPNRVLVVDSMTFGGLAAMRQVLAINGRMGQTPFQSDWGQAMELLEGMLALLYSDAIKCHVIVNTHIVYVENEQAQVTKGLPTALGQKLPPKVPRYFNTVVMAKTKGTGANAKKVIRTVSEGIVELKNPAPSRVPPELPLETGLADLFRALQHKEK